MSTLKSILKRTSVLPPPPSYQIPQFTPHAPSVIQMFQSQYTQNLPDRKANAIIKYTKLRPDGFFYQQIQDLTKIIKYAEKDLFSGVTQMFQALQCILEIGKDSTFFNKRRSSDGLKFMPLLPGFFNSLEPLITYEDYIDTQDQGFERLRFIVIGFINRYSYEGIPEILKAEESFENKKSEGVEISPLQSLREFGTKNLQALLETNLIDPLLKLPTKYENNWEFLYSLISTFSYLMRYKKFAGVLCDKDILKLVIDVIFLCQDFRSDIIKVCLEIVWNAIEGIGVQVVLNLVNQQTVFQLKNLFKTIMAEGYKLQDSCLRNQLLVLVNYLLSIPESIPFFLDRTNLITGEEEYSFFENLLGCASVDEETFYSTKNRVADKKPEFGTTIEDLEFKKLIWSGILTAMQSNYPEIIQIIEEAQFLKHLLLYIDPMANSYAVNRWSDPQIREIQLHCLSILANIVLYMKNHFEEKKGLFCLAKFLASTNDSERRESCLKAFNNASLFEEGYKLKIAEEGVIDQIIGFLQHEEENSLEIRELCFSILANLCRDCKQNKKIFREKGGIDIVIRNLKDPNIITSSRYALLAFSVLTCLWNSILGSKRSEGLFLDGEGLYVLLQFLEQCDTMHRKMGLSSISYLIQNQKTVLFFSEWNSTKTMRNATQLLISIYQQQDQRFGVKYQNGLIKNKTRPLIPNPPNTSQIQSSVTSIITNEKQTTQLIESNGESYLIRKIKEKVKEYDLRAIIFSILYRTGFNKHGLHAEEQQRIEVIQMYPNFKIGEIWGDIKRQLEEEGIKPTTEDDHWMKTSIEEFEEEMSNCINTQALINREFNKVQEKELGKFYETIKNSRSK